MLSFMREQGVETGKPAASQSNSELPGTMPVSQSQEYLTVTHKKQVRKSTHILFIFFAVGLVCLFIMIKKSAPQSASASVSGDSQIDAMLSKLSGASSEMFSSLDEISERFYKFSQVQQVKNNELLKNPFKTDPFYSGWQNNSQKQQTDYSSAEPKKTNSESNPGHMQLLSIMADSSKSCCMIDDKILYVNDVIKGFRITEIATNLVKLEQEQQSDLNGKTTPKQEIILKLAE